MRSIERGSPNQRLAEDAQAISTSRELSVHSPADTPGHPQRCVRQATGIGTHSNAPRGVKPVSGAPQHVHVARQEVPGPQLEGPHGTDGAEPQLITRKFIEIRRRTGPLSATSMPSTDEPTVRNEGGELTEL